MPGRVLINAPLVKGLKPMSNAKAPAAVIMFLISSVDGAEERAMHMFRRAGGGARVRLGCPRGCGEDGPANRPEPGGRACTPALAAGLPV